MVETRVRSRRSIRLKNYDYSQAGAYFVTVCVNERWNLFGGIEDGKMKLNDAGRMVDKWWRELFEKYKEIQKEEYCIMPNHFHGIIQIMQTVIITQTVGADLRVCPHTPLGEHIGSPLHKIVQWFKTMSTNEYIRNVKNKNWLPFNKHFWQRNYYEHVIRDEDDLNRIREYVVNNPAKWKEDEYYGAKTKT